MKILERIEAYSEGSKKALKECNSIECRMSRNFSWEPSIGISQIYELFKKVDIAGRKSFCELGAGDARVSLLAELAFGLDTTAVEYNHDTYNITKKRIEKDFPESGLKLLHEDYEDMDISNYGSLYNYPWKKEETMFIAEKALKNKDALVIVHGWYRGDIEIMHEKGYSLKEEAKDLRTRIYSLDQSGL